jgi:quercetin dioxygenase-like cupin family protein
MMSLKAIMIVAAAMLVAGGGAPARVPPRQPGITRTDLQRHDLGIAGREAIQVRVDFAAGAVSPRHRHPGDEIVYVLKGSLEYRLEGKPPVMLGAGGVLFIPTGTVHGAANVGRGVASELATYVVEKGKPLVVPVP